MRLKVETLSNIAIICEYNPFHNGHKFQIESQKKALGAKGVVAIMSGNFVQRGAPAICDKWQRTKMALSGGADLVIELPLVYATQSAERFARGGVMLADSLGIVDYLSFGTECDDPELLKRCADILSEKEVKERCAELLKTAISYPAARAKAAGEDFSEILSEPNNILAIEYIKALGEIKSKIIPVPHLRKGCMHDSDKTEGKYASASFLRKQIENGGGFEAFLPKESENILKNAPIFKDKKALDAVITYLLRTMDEKELLKIADMSEGLEHRFIKAAKSFATADEIAEFVKTKRYTKTRIDRLLINILLSIKKDDIEKEPSYIRVLGFNETGSNMLSEIKKKSQLPLITNVADADFLGESYKMLFKDICATDIYSLLLSNGKSGQDYTTSPIVVSKRGF